MAIMMTLHNANDIQRITGDLQKIINGYGIVNIAYSSQPMKVTDYSSRGITQNALFHVWIREACAYTFKENIGEAEIEGMKRYIKRECYIDTKQKFLTRIIRNPADNTLKNEYTSSAKWDKGEMKFVLDFMQRFYAERGLILEARGEYCENQN